MRLWLPILALLAGLGSSFSFGQSSRPSGSGESPAEIPIIDCIEQKIIHVSRVQGRVFDHTGGPIADALVTLSSDGKLALQARTDQQGAFAFKALPGKYHLKATAAGFTWTEAEVDSGKDASNLFRPSNLWVFLAVGADSCPWIVTSNREFKRAIHEYATQK